MVRDAGRTFIVDAMSSFGGVDIPVADWGIDFLVSSANKCIQGVPGFSFILCRRDKLLASEGKARSLSLDLLDQWKGMEKDGKWRFTSPTHVVLAFSKALDELAQEGGIPARSRRYTENNRLLIEKMRAMGFATYIDGTQERLGRVLLPLGELRKEADVRRIAREQGFENAGKRDSQGICFVPDDDFASYIETRRGQALPEGDIVDAAGNVLGRHRGAIRYTIGQRKGLGVACAHPVYVTAIDAAANTVTLGEPEDLMATGLVADDWIWSVPADAMEELLDEAGATGLPAGAKIRYHHPTRACRMRRGADGSIELAFDEAERGIAPGQAVVAYAGDVVLGGGTVVRALR